MQSLAGPRHEQSPLLTQSRAVRTWDSLPLHHVGNSETSNLTNRRHRHLFHQEQETAEPGFPGSYS